MCFKCQVCESEQQENVFFFKESVKSPHRLDCIVYQNFLNLVSSKTNLTTTMVDILYFNNKLDDIVNIKDIWDVSIDKLETKISDNIVFNENYEKSLGFIFANMIQLNKNYDIHLNLQIYNNIYDLDLLNNQKKYNIRLSISKPTYKKEDFEILLFSEFNHVECIPYDISLLNEKEKDDLLKKINNDENDIFLKRINKQLPIFNCIYDQRNEKILFKNTFVFNPNEEIDSIYINLEQKIEKFYKKVENLHEFLKNENKSFFERVLIEKEIEYF